MKRWLEYNDSADAVNALSRKDLFRTAHEYKLITNPKLWFQFHALRNESSHTYNISVAEEIYGAIPSFIGQTQTLFEALEAKND